MPVTLVLSTNDAPIPHATSRLFLDTVLSDDTTIFEFPTGHVGTLVGASAHAAWHQRVDPTSASCVGTLPNTTGR
ncbi:hypothetical protein [Halocatena salina]|uniref:Uncharacterized protein n=1 Tax=Halocatena salina TaxID=2934340 RepID=A0A8U0A6K1_9EURY|nr:hypothetical protein [Halocatena salina]UPM44644.1 hypothetical protein MW046_16520 [Halocatena salina]